MSENYRFARTSQILQQISRHIGVFSATYFYIVISLYGCANCVQCSKQGEQNTPSQGQKSPVPKAYSCIATDPESPGDRWPEHPLTFKAISGFQTRVIERPPSRECGMPCERWMRRCENPADGNLPDRRFGRHAPRLFVEARYRFDERAITRSSGQKRPAKMLRRDGQAGPSRKRSCAKGRCTNKKAWLSPGLSEE
ncbi:hypothetical protein FHW37_102566 [Neorhizobium alkalisoli]|uniref:Uncharacterized protein n=1 Tax=Neorhizobium alkalisoli TaxID=528178 RepID=A0A561R2U0_9HYPH|nr:hypothetical protein FHW37_102566 [Neorhizobium alkalisoli]